MLGLIGLGVDDNETLKKLQVRARAERTKHTCKPRKDELREPEAPAWFVEWY